MPPARIALWVASIGAIAVLVRSLSLGPIPVWLAAALMVGYLGLMATGIAWPQLEMFADAIWRGKPGKRLIALTFDGGPHPQTTRAILSILARGGHRATFFVARSKVEQHPQVVRDIVARGHTVGIRGDSPAWGYAWKPPADVMRDIHRSQDAVGAACGIRPNLFRPPIGLIGPRTGKGAEKARTPIVLWSVTGGDADRVRPQTVVRRVQRGLKDAAIVRLHDALERADYVPASVEALPAILERIDELGLETVGVETFVSGPTYVENDG